MSPDILTTQFPGIMIAIPIIKAIFFAISIFFIVHGIYLLYKLGLIKEKIDFYSDAFTRKKAPLHKDAFLLEWEKTKNPQY